MELRGAYMKLFLLANVEKGKELHIEEIQKLIEENYDLTAEDWKPCEGSTYPRWKSTLSGVLQEMKKAKLVKHDEVAHTYTF